MDGFINPRAVCTRINVNADGTKSTGYYPEGDTTKKNTYSPRYYRTWAYILKQVEEIPHIMEKLGLTYHVNTSS
jgi:hypothetical protein